MYTLMDRSGQVSIKNTLKNDWNLCISENIQDLEAIKRILNDNSLRIEKCIVCPCCGKEIIDYVYVHSIDLIDLRHYCLTNEYTSKLIDICDDCFSDLAKYIPSYDSILNNELIEPLQEYKRLKADNDFYRFANSKAESDYFMLGIPQK